MIRHFDWRDVALLYRLRGKGLCLNAQLGYTRGDSVMQHALLGALMPGRSACTLVGRRIGPDGLPMVGQFCIHRREPNARLAFFAPGEALTQPAGQKMLEALGQAAGARGAQNLIAEVGEDGLAFESLRRAGFAIYARQRIWYLPLAVRLPHGGAVSAWRPEQPSDQLPVQGLYLDLVPALVQQVEPPPMVNGRGAVHWFQGALLGYMEVDRGPQAIWVHPYFHPEAGGLDALLAGFLELRSVSRDRPLYMSVRSYQEGLSGVLQHLGFEPWEDQAVMVKRLVCAVRRPALATLRRMERASPEPTAPFTHIQTDKSSGFRVRKP